MVITDTPYSEAAFKSIAPTILPRRISSLALIVLLYTAATPFAPISWLTGPVSLSGTYFLDRVLAGIVLFCAFYFRTSNLNQSRVSPLSGCLSPRLEPLRPTLLASDFATPFV
jgi:hypothetical protein